MRGSKDVILKKAKIGAIILSVAVLMAVFLAIFDISVNFEIFISFVMSIIILILLGAAITLWYANKYFNEASRKEKEKITKFIQEWERERWRKP